MSIDSAVRFSKSLLTVQGVPDDIAQDVALHLVESDRVGHSSHGLSILPNYCLALQDGHVDRQGRAELASDRGTVLHFNGHNGFGQHVGKVVMQQAIARATELGQCFITLRHSHHLGRIGQYGEMVADAGMILLAFTNIINRRPLVAPFGGTQACLMTNPLCIAGPLPGGRPHFLADMATSLIAVNKARVLAAKGERAPAGSLIDAQGCPVDDPGVLFAEPSGALLPFGGHKGYALNLVIELLAGGLSGGGFVEESHERSNRIATNNMFAILINSKMNFDTDWCTPQVATFIHRLHACPPQPGVTEVQYPGEYEANNRARQATTLIFDSSTWNALVDLARELNVHVPSC